MTEPEHEVPDSRHITRDEFIGTVDGADFYRMRVGGAISIVSAHGPVAVREELIDMELLEELAE